jgi:site-specific recombinase XerD
MVTVDIERLTHDLAPVWSGFMRDWDRTLRAGNAPATTRYNYLLAVSQLGRFLADHAEELGCDDAAEDPTETARGHVESFQEWMIATRSPATALNKHKVLQQFFKWLLTEQEVGESPMKWVRQPQTPKRLIPIIRDDDTRRVLATCQPRTFIDLRDEAIIRLYYNTGARLTEVADLEMDDLDLATDSVRYIGKGDRERRVRFGPKTARSISRYLRARSRRPNADHPRVWLADRGRRPLSANGIKIRLRVRGERAGVARVHAHRWRHNFAHEWKRAGGETGDLMLILGWESEEMARHYGESAAAERAQENQARLGIGENV